MAKAKKEVKEQPVEQVLWAAADKLRKNMDAAEYKHIVLGLIFLKYISDNFYELYHKLEAGEGDYAGADPNDPYEYRAENVFYVPPQARWDYLQSRAKLPTIGKDIDDAMDELYPNWWTHLLPKYFYSWRVCSCPRKQERNMMLPLNGRRSA
jgi:type I restriction enzyme M protein